MAPEAYKQFEQLNILKRAADPSEVTSFAVLLASDEESFVTGGEHVVDGGKPGP
ncbi:hypothetical protein M427DRAFT_57966 [Gonapodya prolifera JEL478]|uniref:NAD(P)-binding protein n=1 Tax=Gonapodya prolifera (strain JEL478) TaxID=1344416 RepID=A0A139ABD7_GONPJ|nr:hypothetical protein M427DRAFT_57966 [Gonapodya prolifera JEL478]|eukprot:KXS13954.1 hypothetical protein M427DRAFT_57966 [Gonapodya prolifera JEL478]